MRGLRFNDYRELASKFDSEGTCGHAIKRGDRIGWCRVGRTSRTECADCWSRWCQENATADFDERNTAGY